MSESDERADERQVENQDQAIAPVRNAYALDQLVAGIADENRHAETDWGPPVGAEVW